MHGTGIDVVPHRLTSELPFSSPTYPDGILVHIETRELDLTYLEEVKTSLEGPSLPIVLSQTNC